MILKPAYIIPLICGMLTMALMLLFSQNLQQREEAYIKALTTKENKRLTQSIEQDINTSIVALKRMADRWEANEGTPQNLWNLDAHSYIEDFSALTTVEWVDNTYHVRWIEPLKGNEKALGLNIAFNEERKQALAGAAQQNKITLTPPLDLVQGYRAFIAYIPLYVNGQFNGFIVGIYDTNIFINNLVSNDISDYFYVTVKDGDKNLKTRQKPLDTRNIYNQTKQIQLFNRTWEISLTPKESYIEEQKLHLPSYIPFIGVLLTLLVMLSVYYALRSREKNRQLLKKQTALSNSENRYQAVINNIADSLITIDSKGIIKSFNKACEALFGYQPEEVIGENIRVLMPFPYAAEHDQYLENCHQSGHKKIIGISREVLAKRKDDSMFPIDLTVSEFYLSEERYFIGIIRDITQRKMTEEALVEAKEKAEVSNTLKSEFLASMSHEIRTPMNGIIGTNHLLLSTTLDKEQRKLVDISLTSATTLLDLINDILDFSKIEAHKLDIESIPFDMHILASNIISMLQVSSQKKNIKLELNYSDSIPESVIGDPNRIRQILLNLVNNAIKFTKYGSVSLTIYCKKVNDYLDFHFSVRDTGIGIAKDKVKSVFNKFEQANQSTTREYGGTGLGLAICQQLTHLMGGEIGVDSELGLGSNFYFSLPLKRNENKELENINDIHSIHHSAKNKMPNLKGMHILVAEDNEINQVIISTLLEQCQCDITIVNNGKEAVEHVSQRKYDLIFMDCQMPVMDGFMATEAIRAYEIEKQESNKLTIIAFTANAIQGDKDKCIAAGMDDYLSKPVEPEALAQIIKKWLPE